MGRFSCPAPAHGTSSSSSGGDDKLGREWQSQLKLSLKRVSDDVVASGTTGIELARCSKGGQLGLASASHIRSGCPWRRKRIANPPAAQPLSNLCSVTPLLPTLPPPNYRQGALEFSDCVCVCACVWFGNIPLKCEQFLPWYILGSLCSYLAKEGIGKGIKIIWNWLYFRLLPFSPFRNQNVCFWKVKCKPVWGKRDRSRIFAYGPQVILSTLAVVC